MSHTENLVKKKDCGCSDECSLCSPLSKEHVNNLLKSLSPLTPTATHLEPSYSHDSRIKAVIFDIYGTLLISATGDIDGFDLTSETLENALEKCGSLGNKKHVDSKFLKLALEFYKPTIQHELDLLKTSGVSYPEVNIINIWRKIITRCIDEGLKVPEVEINCRELAFIFEVMSNHVAPMPDMVDLVKSIASNEMPLGIISNAQFYTPIIMNYLLNGGVVVEGEQIANFQHDLCVYSYKHHRAKPESMLFNLLKQTLNDEYDIKAEETLYIGNDMYKDIWPANKAGMKTVLFAGDKRSLRLRADKPEVKSVVPDFIVTELSQIKDIIGI